MRWSLLTRLGSIVAGALALGACSSDEVKGGAGGTQGTGAGASTGGAWAVGGEASSGNGGSGPSCTGTSAKAELPAIDLFVALDSSDSMYFSASGGSTRWGQVTSALLGFFRDPTSAGVGVDLGFFPVPLEDVPDTCTSDEACGEGAPCRSKICLNLLVERDELVSCESNTNCEYGTETPPTCRTIGDCATAAGSFCFTESPDSCDGTCTPSGICSRFVSCLVSAYEEPAVTLARLPEAQSELAGAVQARQPGDDTTTAPALSATLERARAWAASHPEHEVMVVLVTGGLPSACFAEGASPEEAVAELAALAHDAAESGVKSHVIGVFSAQEMADGARSHLNGVAEAGGTGSAVVIDSSGNVANEVAGALSEIRGLQRGCEFQAPDTADYDEVNVLVRSGSTTDVVARVRDVGACDGTRGGWHYDVAPGSDPRRITLCPTSCVALRLTDDASVELELGCPSQTFD